MSRPDSPNAGVIIDPQGPAQDSSPENLVTDFLRASGASVAGDFSVARQFLTPEAAARWNPATELRIYQDTQNPAVSQTRNGAIRVSAAAAGTLDDRGRYTSATPDAILNAEFSLVKNAEGQWRIATLDDGIMIPSSIFQSLYAETILYFLTPDRAALVPEARWYLNSSQAVSAVEGLIGGPSQWLATGAHSALPAEASLTTRGVTITDGVAHVDFSADVATLPEADRIAMEAQVSKTLMNVSGVQSVKLTSQGAELDIPEKRDLSSYPYSSYTLTGLSNGLPATVSSGTVTQISAPEGLALTAIAPSYSDPASWAAGLGNGGQTIYNVSLSGDGASPMIQGTNLVAPSVDRHGWVWTTEREANAKMQAFHRDSGQHVVFDVSWLQGLTVRDIAVSREGARMVVVAERDGQAQMIAAAIARDTAGVPIEIGEPLRFGQSQYDVADVAWTSEVRVAALARNQGTSTSGVVTVGLGVPGAPLASADNVVAIAAGRGTDSVVIQNANNDLLSYDGAGWRVIAEDVTAPAYPG
ncbi:LpqB family beta-propeller domain-containing protein [Trueperella bialowiezensis]|uniref:LpqB family beta-propeller domain-containing protein n=1 Tax=Trueperella bialowiezensis TaxID=312285 RepID=UPI0013DF0900|nr:LpqB family beta-propeller domain-containing protein [Trueperella bialowiezensis]